jgi:hypothetical protein
MNLSTGWTELNAALKSMRLQWQEIRLDWNDSVRRGFEENHWKPLEAQVIGTLRAIDRLAPILAKAQQECS